MSTVKKYIEDKLSGADSSILEAVKANAKAVFMNEGFPTVKDEDWKYSNLKKMVEADFDLTSTQAGFENDDLLSFGQNVVTILNGQYQENSFQSNDKIKVLDLSRALIEIPDVLEKHFGKYATNPKDSLSALNVALSEVGVVVYIPANTCVEEPLVIRNIVDAKTTGSVINVHHLVVLEKNAEAKLVEIFHSEGDHMVFENVVTEIALAPDAKLDYYKIQNQSDAMYHVGTTQVYQDQKSYFYSATITLNGGFIRNNLNVVLDGEHIDNHLYGLYIPNGKQHVDNHTLVDHRKPNCNSNELYKGVLDDKSTGVFNGKIFVQEDAQKTNAYQNCRNVILSDTATMNTKPQLEIWADDVKCSHGTTTGQLNDEAIFYMQSRGIPKKEAIRMQIVAFAEDVVSQIKIDGLKDILDRFIENKLN